MERIAKKEGRGESPSPYTNRTNTENKLVLSGTHGFMLDDAYHKIVRWRKPIWLRIKEALSPPV